MSNLKMSETAADGFHAQEHHVEQLPFLGLFRTGVRVTLADKYGNVKGEDLITRETLKNSLTNAGADYLFNVGFGQTSKIQNWWMGLVRGATAADMTTPGTPGTNPTAASTLASIADDEAAIGGNYARQPITWVTYVNGQGTQQTRHAKTGNIVWTASGAWTQGATHLFLCTAANGTVGLLFNYTQLLSTRRPTTAGDTITASWDGAL